MPRPAKPAPMMVPDQRSSAVTSRGPPTFERTSPLDDGCDLWRRAGSHALNQIAGTSRAIVCPETRACVCNVFGGRRAAAEQQEEEISPVGGDRPLRPCDGVRNPPPASRRRSRFGRRAPDWERILGEDGRPGAVVPVLVFLSVRRGFTHSRGQTVPVLVLMLWMIPLPTNQLLRADRGFSGSTTLPLTGLGGGR